MFSHFFESGQFMGFSGSSGPSQSTIFGSTPPADSSKPTPASTWASPWPEVAPLSSGTAATSAFSGSPVSGPMEAVIIPARPPNSQWPIDETVRSW